MSKGKKALLLLLFVINIPVIILAMNGWHASNEGWGVYCIMTIVSELVSGFVLSILYIIENWD